MFRRTLPLLIVILVLSACAPPSRDPKKESKNLPAEKIVYSTVSAIIRDVPAYIQATGSFVAEETSDVAPAIAGRVASTPVEIGDLVKKGQLLCTLEDRDARLKLDQVRAGLEQAKFLLRQAQSRVGLTGNGKFDPEAVPEVAAAHAAYQSAMASAKLAAADARRYENLVKSGDVSQSAYEKSKTQQETAEAAANSSRKQYEAQVNAAQQSFRAIEASQASLAISESQLALAHKGVEDANILAPFDGFISDRPVSIGQWLGTNSKVATIMRIATVKLRMQIPEQQSALVKSGMAVTARVAAYADRDFVGRIIAVVPSVDSNSRAFMAEARFNNPKAELRPGMFANAKAMLQGSERAIFIPSKAVFYDNTTDANHVYCVANGVAHLKVVLKGDTDGEQVRIINGLKGDEVVVLNNQSALFDGARIETH
jgi:multidrug efflux pump subunit AcrA (membrane-fusion protein)